MATKVWGDVFGATSKAFVFPFAVGKGVVNLANGQKFDNGYDDVYDSCQTTIKEIEEFGDRHSDDINNSIKTVALGVTTFVIGSKVINKNKKK